MRNVALEHTNTLFDICILNKLLSALYSIFLIIIIHWCGKKIKSVKVYIYVR